MFHVGQKVVCVEPTDDLVKGQIYTVLSILCDGLIKVDRTRPGIEWLFYAHRFRPVVERNTDISIFTALLNPSPQKVRESIGYDLGFTAEEIGLS